jgi:hypothetical protein
VERDQHSGPEQGGEKAGNGARDVGPVPDLSRLREDGPEVPTESEPQGVVPEPAAPEQPGVQADVIMSRLPRTRPQRVTGRRRREPARGEVTQAAPAAPARAAGTQATGPAPRAQKRTTARPKASAAAAAPTVKPKRTAPAAPAARTAPRTEPARRTPTTGGAASLPRLAVDGAVEAAKLPLKVGGRLTLRALEAVARSLRNS